MLIGADQFFSHFDLMRTVAIVGEKGTYKDMLTMEIAEYYLNKHGYKFFSNQACVWNDQYYEKEYLDDVRLDALRKSFVMEGDRLYQRTVRDNSFLAMLFGFEPYTEILRPITDDDLREFSVRYGADVGGMYERIPTMQHSFLSVSEGGSYLREWAYFSNLQLLTRKLDMYVAIPCARPPHVDLCRLLVENIVPFQRYLGFGGGLFKWQVLGSAVPGAELSRNITGHFIYLPREVGLYDSHDLSVSPTEIIEWFSRQIDYLQRRKYGRDGIQAMATGQSDADSSAFFTVAGRLVGSSLSVQNRRPKRR